MKKILFLINPVSGSSPGPIVAQQIADELEGRLGLDEYDIIFTKKDVAGQTRELAADYEIIIGAGGDGTFGQIVQAVAKIPDPPKVGNIPYGVGNDLARSLGVFDILKRRGIPGIINMVLAGKTRWVDVLHVNNNYLFSSYFGVGNDAKISNAFNELRPKTPRTVAGVRIGINRMLYTALVLRNLVYTIPSGFQMKYNSRRGREISVNLSEGVHGLLITNSGIYAGGSIMSSKTDLSDGRFEVTIIKDIRHWWAMHLTRFFNQPLDMLSTRVTQFSTDWLHLTINGNTFFQVDGEDPGPPITNAKELEFTVSHQMEMIVP